MNGIAMSRTIAEKQLILQVITILAGILFLVVITTANFYVYHTSAKHIDSADQGLTVAKNEKIKKLLPVLGENVHLISLDMPIQTCSIFIKESFSAYIFTLLYLIPPRSPPK
jgi:hypothetical protein